MAVFYWLMIAQKYTRYFKQQNKITKKDKLQSGLCKMKKYEKKPRNDLHKPNKYIFYNICQ